MQRLRKVVVPACTQRVLAAVSLLFFLLVAVCLLAGCVTSKKYRLAKANTPAAQPMDLGVVATPVNLTVATVIVFRGPGSWKREARWDEYRVSLTNHVQQPVTIASVELVDLLGQAQPPGDDPWKLEKLSRSNWDRYGKAGLKLAAGVGAVALYAGAVVASGYTFVLSGGAVGGTAAGLAVIPVFGLVDVAAVAVMNRRNKASVQQEFRRRRITLPRTIRPGEVLAGSLFFPMTPGPQRMVVRGDDSGHAFEVVLELQPLAGLHLRAKP